LQTLKFNSGQTAKQNSAIILGVLFRVSTLGTCKKKAQNFPNFFFNFHTIPPHCVIFEKNNVVFYGRKQLFLIVFTLKQRKNVKLGR